MSDNHEEPRKGVLYEFDWKTAPTRQWKTLPNASGTQLGWFDGRNWVACFGDGMWSPEFVVAYRVAEVAALRAERDAELRHCEELSVNATAEARRADAAEAERDAIRASLSKAELRERLREVERDEARSASDGLRQRVEAAADEIERQVTAFLPDGADHCERAANDAFRLAANIARAALAADSPEPERPTAPVPPAEPFCYCSKPPHFPHYDRPVPSVAPEEQR